MIEYMLGEVWIAIGKQKWQGLAFTRLSKGDMDEIIYVGKGMGRGGKPEQTEINKVIDLMNRVG